MLALEDSQTCAGVTESDVVALYSRQIGEERLWLMCPIGRLTHPRAESVHQTHERAGLEETSSEGRIVPKRCGQPEEAHEPISLVDNQIRHDGERANLGVGHVTRRAVDDGFVPQTPQIFQERLVLAVGITGGGAGKDRSAATSRVASRG